MKKIAMILAAMVFAVGFAAAAGTCGISFDEKAAIEKAVAFHFPGKPVVFVYVAASDTVRIVVGDTWYGIYAEYEVHPLKGWVHEIWYRPNFKGQCTQLFNAISKILNRPASEALKPGPKE